MKQGYKVIDTDTHVGPNLETLVEYASPRLKERWDELDGYRMAVSDGGHHLSISPFPYKRRLRQSTVLEESGTRAGGQTPLKGAVSAVLDVPPVPGVNNLNSAGRLEDMDREGVDVHLIIPATFALAVTALDGEMASEIHAAYRRYIAEYCSVDPSRLKATVPVLADRAEESAAVVRELANEPWVAAITPVLPEQLPIDDPVLDPVWAAMNDADLPIMHHSFFYEPPYFPGYRDLWGNVVVARAAAHPWGAQRLLGYLVLSGLFDQYPNLRIGFAECSAGWLPAWLIRLRGQAAYMRNALPESVHDPVDYAKEGRIFCGIELYEGEEMAKSINDLLGDGVIMYQSDYPHNGCEFPNSPDIVLGWDGLGETAMRKLMSENAERYLRM
ncbi:MAG: amidohydrolase family protein [Ilumatobacteraceae bacterium]